MKGILALLGIAIMATLGPATARANMANPSQPGDVIGEPSGALAELAIEHESLSIDLRPLADAETAAVEATYEIRNDGAEATIDLVFVAPSYANPSAADLYDESAVTLDGSPVAFQVDGTDSVDWPPPSTTPGVNGGRLPYSTTNGGQLRFSVTVTPGPHSIAVRYAARPSRYSGNGPTVYWQLGYVLAPARQWANFGTLDVLVQLPAGWNAASDPALVRTGDELRGTFSGVPADALALTAQLPPPPTSGIPVWSLLALATVLIGGLLGWAGGRSLGRRGSTALWLFPLALVYGAGAAVATTIVGVAAESARPEGIPASQVAWTYGYGNWIVPLLLAPVIGIVAGVVLQVAALISARRARPAPPAPGTLAPW